MEQAHPSKGLTNHIILTLNFTYTVPYQSTLIAPISSQTRKWGPMSSSNQHFDSVLVFRAPVVCWPLLNTGNYRFSGKLIWTRLLAFTIIIWTPKC